MSEVIFLRGLTQDQVRGLFDYCQDTGLLTWRVRPANSVKLGDVAGSKNNEGYMSAEIKGVAYKIHRLVWLWMTGAWPESCIDHVNGDRSDNRWANLRLATRSQNGQNRKLNANNKSGYIGVYPFFGKWRAQIAIKGKQIYIGTFDTVEDAAKAYAQKKRELHAFNPVAVRATARKSK